MNKENGEYICELDKNFKFFVIAYGKILMNFLAYSMFTYFHIFIYAYVHVHKEEYNGRVHKWKSIQP